MIKDDIYCNPLFQTDGHFHSCSYKRKWSNPPATFRSHYRQTFDLCSRCHLPSLICIPLSLSPLAGDTLLHIQDPCCRKKKGLHSLHPHSFSPPPSPRSKSPNPVSLLPLSVKAAKGGGGIKQRSPMELNSSIMIIVHFHFKINIGMPRISNKKDLHMPTHP